jgi:hypothetical protein
MIQGGSKLMSWQEDKLAISSASIDDIYHHLDYKMGNRAEDLDIENKDENFFRRGGRTPKKVIKVRARGGYSLEDFSPLLEYYNQVVSYKKVGKLELQQIVGKKDVENEFEFKTEKDRDYWYDILTNEQEKYFTVQNKKKYVKYILENHDPYRELIDDELQRTPRERFINKLDVDINDNYAGGGSVEIDAKKIGNAKRLKVKNWYIKNYPTDDLGKEINDNLSFWSFYTYLFQGVNVYSVLGVGDSIVRERVFEKLAEILGVQYDYIYKLWLKSSDKYAGGGGVGDYKKVNTFQDIKNDPRVSDAYREDVDEEKMYWMHLKDGFVSIWDSGASIVAENMQYLKDTLNIKGVVITKEEWDKEDDDEYAGGGEIEDWMQSALYQLQAEEDNDNLQISFVKINEFTCQDDDANEYRVFKNEDVAEEMAVEEVREDIEYQPENFNRDFLMDFVDVDDFLVVDIENINYDYVKDIEDESNDKYANRLIAELIEYGLISENEALTTDPTELSDEYSQDYIDLLTSEQIGDDNGVQYFIDNFGEDEFFKIVIDNNLIDFENASQDAVNMDGIAHFLARYDGETIYLDNNVVAYRTN